MRCNCDNNQSTSICGLCALNFCVLRPVSCVLCLPLPYLPCTLRIGFSIQGSRMCFKHAGHCFDHSVELLLPLRFPSIERLLGHAHRHLLLPSSQAFIRFLRELIERHPDVLEVWLMLVKFRCDALTCCPFIPSSHCILSFTLYRRRVELHHLHCSLL